MTAFAVGTRSGRDTGLRGGRRALVAAGAAALLTFGLAPPGAADAPAATRAPYGPSVRPTGIADRDGMDLLRTEQPLAPGAELTSFHRLESDKWLSGHALTVDLTRDLRIDYLSPGPVAATAPLGDLVAAHDPGEGRTTVAAVNGDFFDINATGAPLGAGVADGALVQSPSGTATQAVGIGPGGAGRVLDLFFDGTLTLPDGGTLPLDGYNAADVPPDGIGLYTAQWGAADRALPVAGAADVTEVTVTDDGEVTSVRRAPGSGPVPQDAYVLLGRDAGAAALAALETGEEVVTAYAPRTGDGGPLPRTAVGGRGILVAEGEPLDWEGLPNNATAPRTAVGFSRNGQEMYLLSVDGRQARSGGATLTELAVMMADLGAWSALNLDGGGSTTLLARAPGDAAPRLVNSPSDGGQRPVPNGLAVTAPEGGGRVTGFRVATAADPAAAPTADPVPGGHPDRVFPGLTRRLTATGYDETYGPGAGAPDRWLSARPGVGRVGRDGVFTARAPGTTEVTAVRGRARGSLDLTVLGELTRITPTTTRVGLPGPAAEGRFGVLGHDAAGDTAPIEPADVRLAYDRDRFVVTPDVAGGGFTVRAAPGTASGSGTVTVTVRGATAVLGVTVGLTETVVADFDDPEDAGAWRFSHARAGGSLAPEPAGHDGGGLRLTYDFRLSTATRAAYAAPPADIPVPGQPLGFALWIDGDGRGAWPSLHLVDAQGTDQVLRGEYVTWTGWREVVFTVPEGVAYPVSVRRFYLAETRPDQQYADAVVVDGLRARTPPDVTLPETAPVADPVIATAADTAGRDWRFAVVSDAQFVAREPDSPIVATARRTLREVRAADPDFVVVNGDWVDEGSDADLAFGRRVLEEELGDAVPWFYVPGNHEVMGGGIDRFEAEFGASQLTFDHRGTRFVTLDTSSLTLRGAGYAQFQRLRAELDAAADDPSVGSVVVVSHVPPRDTTVRPASQLTDRLEAALLEDWLADFHRDSGKGVAFLGAHVGVFDAYRLGGVPYVIGGDAGKRPAAAPGDGGFTGWALVGVDDMSRHGRPGSRQGSDWLSVRTMPHVDGLDLDAPAVLPVGGSARVVATVEQRDASGVRAVPVAFPVSADWTGARGLHVGPARTADRRAVAAFDPATGELTGLRPGRVTLAVTVAGVRREAVVTVRR